MIGQFLVVTEHHDVFVADAIIRRAIFCNLNLPYTFEVIKRL
jgi:hypothetical protein